MQTIRQAIRVVHDLASAGELDCNVKTAEAFLSALDDDVVDEIQGHVDEKLIGAEVFQAEWFVFPSQQTIERVATRAGLEVGVGRNLMIEVWRACEELRWPLSANSRLVPDKLVNSILVAETPDGMQFTDWYLVSGGPEYHSDGQSHLLCVEEDQDYLACIVFLLRCGCRYFQDHEHVVAAARDNGWLGWEEELSHTELQLATVRRRLPSAIEQLNEHSVFIFGVFDNVEGNRTRCSIWVLHKDRDDVSLQDADIWARFNVTATGEIGERGRAAAPNELTLVQWRMRRRSPKDGLLRFSARSTGTAWTVPVSDEDVIRHDDLEKQQAAREEREATGQD